MPQVDITINASVFIMGQCIVSLRRHVSITGGDCKGVDCSSPSLFWALKSHERSESNLGPKQARAAAGQPPYNRPSYGYMPPQNHNVPAS